MTLESYFQDELAYLHEMGESFSDEHPGLAPYLSQKGTNPDVERLLEGFAFIAAKLRKKLDDELPELSMNLHSVLWPEYLRPVPSMSIVEFTPLRKVITTKNSIAKGTEVRSIEIDGTSCRFQTCYDVDIYPLKIQNIKVENHNNSSLISVGIEVFDDVDIKNLNIEKLRFYLDADKNTNYKLYDIFFNHLTEINISGADENNSVLKVLKKSALAQVGFKENEMVLPHSRGQLYVYRLIQEYFTLPHKYLFFDLFDIGDVNLEKTGHAFNVNFVLDCETDSFLRINNKSIKLHCVPVVNLFQKDAEPVRMNKMDTKYPVTVCDYRKSHYEVYSIKKVSAWDPVEKKQFDLKPLHKFVASENESDDMYYSNETRPVLAKHEAGTYVNIVNRNAVGMTRELLSMELVCTNKNLAAKLKVGDICVPTDSTPQYVSVKNIVPVTKRASVPCDSGLPWKIIKHISNSYGNLDDIETIRDLITTFHYQMHHNKQAYREHCSVLNSLQTVCMKNELRLIDGLAMHGHVMEFEVKGSHFINDGEMYVFFTILHKLMQSRVPINSFIAFVVKDIESSKEHKWPLDRRYK